MKIGIVTTYDEINFGAYLQAYSLQKYLESLGYDVEFINYKSFNYKKAEAIATYKTNDFLYLLKIILKSVKFHKALSHCKVSKKYQSVDKINKAKYDVIIYGSDEIWNVNSCIGGDVDPYYFGESIKTTKISYAPSFGSTITLDGVEDNIKNSLLEFKRISLRDKNSYNIIKTLSSAEPNIVLDPTFLIEQPFVNSDIKEKYIFYYCSGKNIALDCEVEELSKKIGVKVISFGYKHNRFKSIVSIDPFEWLGHLKNAEYIVTDMFHGTIFSVKYKKKFVVCMTEYRENKLGFLLDLLDLKDRIYKKGEIERMISNQINYTKTDKIISKMLKSSETFLQKALQC